MSTETTWVYPKPGNWDEFEYLVWDLFRRKWQDPDAQRYGRSGQEQHGIDVFGRPQDRGGAYVGVQCKRYEEGTLTEKVIRAEVGKVDKGVQEHLLPFTPVELVIATTASRDVSLQNAIIHINEERAASGSFSVSMRFWEDLTDMLASPGYEDLLHKHYPTLAPVAPPRAATPLEIERQYKTEELSLLKEAVADLLQALQEQVAAPMGVSGNPFPLGKALGLNAGAWLVGRQACVAELVERLNSERTIFLTGAGGVGKTSLLQAGLLPALLEQGCLPLLVEASDEAVELNIKRKVFKEIQNTHYLSGLPLASFLENAADCLPRGKLVVVILDRFEAFFEQSEALRQDFKKEWVLSISEQAQVRWLFSIPLGHVDELSYFQSGQVNPITDRVTLSPLDRESAVEALRLISGKRNIQLDDEIVRLVLDDLNVTSINPSQLMTVGYFMSGGSGPPLKAWTFEEYRRLGAADGILQQALENIIQSFPVEQRQPAWQTLSCLARAPNRRLAQPELARNLKLYGGPIISLPDLLERLQVNHLIDVEDEGYRLASASLTPRIQQWTDQQAAATMAKVEAARQVDQSRRTALRGVIGGALGFVLFDWLISTAPRQIPAFEIIITLVPAAIGAIAGFLLTLNLDLATAATRGKSRAAQYFIGGVGGAAAMLAALLLYTVLNLAPNRLAQVIPTAALEGLTWGFCLGAGAVLALSSERRVWLKVLAASAACGLVLLGCEVLRIELFGYGINDPHNPLPAWWRVFLAGGLATLCLLATTVIGRIHEKESAHMSGEV